MAERREKDRLPAGRKKGPERESEHERRKIKGRPQMRFPWLIKNCVAISKE